MSKYRTPRLPIVATGEYFEFWYRNHRDELKVRRAIPVAFGWLKAPGFGYEPGWFLTAYDINKQALRSFAVHKMWPIDALPRANPAGHVS